MEDKKFLLLLYKNFSKKVCVNGKLTLPLVQANVYEKFGIQNGLLQCWDDDVTDFVDMEASTFDEIHKQKVLKVRVISNENDMPSIIGVDNTDKHTEIEDDVQPEQCKDPDETIAIDPILKLETSSECQSVTLPGTVKR